MANVGIIFGTRPEAIKMAPIVRGMRDDKRFNLTVISTGQHREMLSQTLSEFQISPDYQLDVMSPGQTLTQTTQRILEGTQATKCLEGLDALMVHGDTATTLAGALAGAHQQIPIIHVEAGLRSGDSTSPFPEETNRKLVAQVASLHLAATPGNAANLIREGINESTIFVTGNTVVDSLRWAVAQQPDFTEEALRDLESDPRRAVLATAHRRESHGEPMSQIALGLSRVAEQREDVRIVLPLHLNPRVREAMSPHVEGKDNITVVAPLPYLEYIRVLMAAYLIVSDSSGAEEEGPALGKPTLVLRELSERHESLDTGCSRLVGRDGDQIVENVTRLLDSSSDYDDMVTAVNPYGDGNATARVIAATANWLNLGDAPEPFVPGLHVWEPQTVLV